MNPTTLVAAETSEELTSVLSRPFAENIPVLADQSPRAKAVNDPCDPPRIVRRWDWASECESMRRGLFQRNPSLTNLLSGPSCSTGTDVDTLGYFCCQRDGVVTITPTNRESSRGLPESPTGIHLCYNLIKQWADSISINLNEAIQFVLVHEVFHARIHSLLPEDKEGDDQRHNPVPRDVVMLEEALAEYSTYGALERGVLTGPLDAIWLGKTIRIPHAQIEKIRQSDTLLPYWIGAQAYHLDRWDRARGIQPYRWSRLRDLWWGTVHWKSLPPEFPFPWARGSGSWRDSIPAVLNPTRNERRTLKQAPTTFRLEPIHQGRPCSWTGRYWIFEHATRT